MFLARLILSVRALHPELAVSAKLIIKRSEIKSVSSRDHPKIRLDRCGFAPMLTTWINYTIKCLHSIPLRDF